MGIHSTSEGSIYHRRRLTGPARFSTDHGFVKPNDETALRLMDAAAIQVMQAYPEVAMAFGESDEFRCSAL